MSAHEWAPMRWMQQCSTLLTAMGQWEWWTRNVRHFHYSLVSALIILLWFLSWIPSATSPDHELGCPPPTSMLNDLPCPATHHQDLAMTMTTPHLPQPTIQQTTTDVVVPQWHLTTQQQRGVSPLLMYWWSRLCSVHCTWPSCPPIMSFWPPKPCTNSYPHPWNTLTHGKGMGFCQVRVKVGVKTPAGYLCPSLTSSRWCNFNIILSKDLFKALDDKAGLMSDRIAMFIMFE